MKVVANAFVAFVNVRNAIMMTKLSPANFASVITSRAIVSMISCVPDPITVRANVVIVIASPAGPEMIAVVKLLTTRAFHPVVMKFVPVTANANAVPAGAK